MHINHINIVYKPFTLEAGVSDPFIGCNLVAIVQLPEEGEKGQCYNQISVCGSVSMSLSLPIPLRLSVTVSHCLSLSLTVSHCLSCLTCIARERCVHTRRKGGPFQATRKRGTIWLSPFWLRDTWESVLRWSVPPLMIHIHTVWDGVFPHYMIHIHTV